MSICRSKKTSVAASMALMFALSLSNTPLAIAHDVAACGVGAVDPDNDGWGWENHASCLVDGFEHSHEPTVGPVVCASSESDTDGDGWGWENSVSCQVYSSDGENGNGSFIPGSDKATATLVPLDTDISDTIVGIESHFYRFELTEQTAISLEIDASEDFIIEPSIEDSNGRVLALTDLIFRSNIPQDVVCLKPGTYYLIMAALADFPELALSEDYTVRLSTTTSRCNVPTNTYVNDIFVSPTAISSDGTVYSSDGRSLTATNSSGILLWESVIADGVEEIFPDDRGNVVVTSGGGLAYINNQGAIDWETRYIDFPSSVVVGELAVIFRTNSGQLRALNVSDGLDRWVYDIEDSVYDISILDDGSVVVTSYSELTVFDQ